MSENTCIRVLADPVQIRQCKAEIRTREEQFNSMSRLLSLAGNEARLKILYLLESEKELCPCDLSDILQMTIQAVSQHLRKMKDGGLIAARKVGQTIFYSLRPENLKTLRVFFKQIQKVDAKQTIHE
jgi:DNA-binding transcriptional ArsR family regulator